MIQLWFFQHRNYLRIFCKTWLICDCAGKLGRWDAGTLKDEIIYFGSQPPGFQAFSLPSCAQSCDLALSLPTDLQTANIMPEKNKVGAL
jgi:hypothetical protein